ncbi:MAG: hypothetical protein JWQ09_5975 [Segetibacter sp.]|nr:hypothetical protein [Segetibacter sp.]
MSKLLLINFIFSLFLSVTASAQSVDSTLDKLQRIPTKYINDIDKKITKYSDRITSKTEKTLTKLSRWEIKIKGLVEKVNPEAANRLFGNNQLTFTSLLEKVKHGEAVALSYKAPYNKYRDDLTTGLKYLSQQKTQLDSGLIKKVKATSNKMKELADEEDKSEALQQFIKDRKKQLIAEAFQYIGKSKYLTKINKEAYYYAETLKNYKVLFADSKKTEETVKTILNKIPAFQRFVQKNSQLASLFGQTGDLTNAATMAGLQTRASVQGLIQDRVASGGPNAMQQIQENLQEAKTKISQLKEKMLSKLAGGSEGGELPDFKPNEQKTKTFLQRLELGTNLQSVKGTSYLPVTSDIGFSIGYKLNDKSVIGMGCSYKLGWGEGIRHIKLTSEGVGLRSFIDWKLKKQLFVSGGFEMNHNSQFANIAALKQYSNWQQAGLLGLKKKINIKTKWFKGSHVQLLYDFLYQQHGPVSQPLLFRIGYSF